MKLTVLSKAFNMAGFMAVLSVMVIPTFTKTAQAQNQDQLQTRMPSPAEIASRAKACDRTLKELGETMGEDGYFYDDFRGVNLTDAQMKAYADLEAKAEAKRTEVYKGSISVADPNARLSFISLPGISVSPSVQSAIQKALNSNPKMDQEATLNQKFGNGKYGLFVGSYITYLTLRQERQLEKITADFYNQMQAIMTPAQKPQYRKNLAGRLKINAVCDMKAPISTYPALGQIRDTVPSAR